MESHILVHLREKSKSRISHSLNCRLFCLFFTPDNYLLLITEKVKAVGRALKNKCPPTQICPLPLVNCRLPQQVTLNSPLFVFFSINHFILFNILSNNHYSPPPSFLTMASIFSYLSLSLTLLFTLTLSITVTESSKFMDHDVKSSIPLVSFLERLQQTAFDTFNDPKFDPKTYVDLPLKFPLSVTDAAFQNLPKTSTGAVSVNDLKVFIGKYFEGAGDDLVLFHPEDFVPEPEGFLPKVKNREVRDWAVKVHSLWKNLSRKVSGEVKAHPSYHTLLPVPGNVVIPGSRFREVYYWDSYWVIRFVF